MSCVDVAFEETIGVSEEIRQVASSAIARAQAASQAVAMEAKNKIKDRPGRYQVERTRVPGINITRYRAAKGWTLRQLGDACIPPRDFSFISRMESGKAGYSEKSLTEVATALGVSVSDLFLPPELNRFPLLSAARQAKIAAMIEDAYTLERLTQPQ